MSSKNEIKGLKNEIQALRSEITQLKSSGTTSNQIANTGNGQAVQITQGENGQVYINMPSFSQGSNQPQLFINGRPIGQDAYQCSGSQKVCFDVLQNSGNHQPYSSVYNYQPPVSGRDLV
jgi:hypothetical protein